MLNSKQPSALTSNTERNPREHVKAITLRSGKELNDHATKTKNNEQKKVKEDEQKGRSTKT